MISPIKQHHQVQSPAHSPPTPHFESGLCLAPKLGGCITHPLRQTTLYTFLTEPPSLRSPLLLLAIGSQLQGHCCTHSVSVHTRSRRACNQRFLYGVVTLSHNAMQPHLCWCYEMLNGTLVVCGCLGWSAWAVQILAHTASVRGGHYKVCPHGVPHTNAEAARTGTVSATRYHLSIVLGMWQQLQHVYHKTPSKTLLWVYEALRVSI